MVAMMQERPSLVQFEVRSVEDRTESIKQGRYVARDVDFAIITPPGGGLTVERGAKDWLVSRQNDPNFTLYQRAYDAWKQGQEEPVNGTSIKLLPFLSPSQVQTLIHNNVRTAEDLATLPENGLQRLGMGARALQQKAQAYLQAAEGGGKLAEEVAALKVQVETLTAELQRVTADNAAMRTELESSSTPRRRKSEAA